MDDPWKELGNAELLDRSYDLIAYCKERNYTTGQSIRALAIAAETIFRASANYRLPPDDVQGEMIEELGKVLVPMFEKHGMSVASQLLFLVGNLVQSSVDIKLGD